MPAFDRQPSYLMPLSETVSSSTHRGIITLSYIECVKSFYSLLLVIESGS